MENPRRPIAAAVIVGIVFLGIVIGMMQFVRLLVQFDPARDTARELGPAYGQP